MSHLIFRRITAHFAPVTARITSNRWMRAHVPAITSPDLWHLNRHSAARGVAIGLFCGLIPGPLQAACAALACVWLRGNVPLALITTFYTNPLTIVPLYVVAYEFGRWVAPATRHSPMSLPPAMSFDPQGLITFLHWAQGLGPSLALGLPLLAATLGVLGYAGVNLLWRCQAVRAWRRRTALRA